MNQIKYSIVIPTYNHCDDLLKPCVESIEKHTDMSNVEVIVVANGCTDNTRDYVNSLGPKYRLLWFDQPLGYTKATNQGISAAKGEYIILLNNDTEFIQQDKNFWLNLLEQPFRQNPKMGLVGPLINYSPETGQNFIVFFCVMIKREVFDQIGLLDEIFSPGYGEDTDFTIRAVNAGYEFTNCGESELVQFEVNGEKREHHSGVFPIWHKNNKTFGSGPDFQDVILKNNMILANKHGKNGNVGKWTWYQGIETQTAYGDDLSYRLGAEFLNDCKTVEDWGCGTCYLSTVLNKSISYKGLDGSWSKFVSNIVNLEKYRSEIKPDGIFMRHVLEHNYNWRSVLENVLASFEKKLVLVLFTPINRNETKIIASNPGIGVPDVAFNIYDILEYLKPFKFSLKELKTDTQYGVEYIFYIEKQTKIINTTIVIPTYNHLEDALRPCLTNVLKFTNLEDKEVIVVSNGSNDGTSEFLESLGPSIRSLQFLDPLGYAVPVNLGIASSNAEHVVLLDNDSILMEQPLNNWIDILYKPFREQTNVGATSPFAGNNEVLGFTLCSGCTMYDRKLLTQIGMFDEIYNPGYLSDIDVSMKIWAAGYKCVEVPIDRLDKPYINGVFTIQFPIVHTGQVRTMNKQKDAKLIERNMQILHERHGKKRMTVKYSIVIPTYNHCDDLLKPCIESIQRATDFDTVEVIIVANGCTDNTREYVESLGPAFRLIWSDSALGYTRATNLGINAAVGEYVVLLNNDVELLTNEKMSWLKQLEAPFSDPAMAITGPLKHYDKYSRQEFLIFFCVMIKREIFNKIGTLDEIFSPGGCEDIDFAIRATQAGFKFAEVGEKYYNGQTNITTFPIWHKNNQTFRHETEYSENFKKNGLINAKRYNKDVKLRLGVVDHSPWADYLCYHPKDSKCDLNLDLLKIDFNNNVVSEIVVCHLFERLNPYKSSDILNEFNRVLKPGGKLIMELADLENLSVQFVNGTYQQKFEALSSVYGDPNFPILFGWWRGSLSDHLSNAGFVNIQFKPAEMPFQGINFRVEAEKR